MTVHRYIVYFSTLSLYQSWIS